MQHKVKGISMTMFSQEDVNEISRAGNSAFNRQYMARHTTKDIHASSTDLNKLKDFIHQKYSLKRWFSEDGSPEPPAQETRKLGASISKVS